jgi:hypothetical protein
MSFLNLGLGELLGLAAIVSAAIVALYLLDRSRRHRVVATLRFWTAGRLPEEDKHRRRIQQPWSLLLQILSVLLLLLAIAGPRLGNPNSARDHVVLLDTSAWMGARARQGILLDQAKAAALAYVNALPQTDRVMLVRTDVLPTPATPFESDRSAVAAAIQNSQPGASALNLEQAFEFAQQAQKLQAQQAGEIVFVGAGRIPRQENEIAAPLNLRVLAIPAAGENVGIRKLGVGRAPDSREQWQAFVGLRNDGSRPREVALELLLAGSPVGTKTLALAAGAEAQETFNFQAKTGGLLEARIRSTNGRGDAFPQDDRAAVELPMTKPLRINVYSQEPESLRALFGSGVQAEVNLRPLASYDPQASADIVVLDRFAPRDPPRSASIWIDPPAGSPFAIKATPQKSKLQAWRQDSPLSAGLYTKDVDLGAAEVFNVAQGDSVVAESADGPVVVARAGGVKMAALGFHPAHSGMKYELAAPLLIANIVHWMAPDAFRRPDAQAGSVGSVNVPLDSGVDRSAIRVLDAGQRPLPFTIEGNVLRFFSGAPGDVRVIAGARETVYSLSLPDVGDVLWQPPANAARGIPRGFARSSASVNWWPWLAIAGAIGLFVDWMLYGRSRVVRVAARAPQPGVADTLRSRKAS